ncbi:LTA synthase family protein [Caloramator sp. Dgby_cultured_2]|uniref:LTA synthase family protein n=1 Tax=Caloramator sp. Dgby_cultured_2 TaxID=3029174 RepID=UPI00237DC02A|nr:LTA synthase family protein [Caloramator sp. Dgby_cultured_2]WDU84411.1 LTA synthase family protein [Caloramator sp. Dgby_cultured_2]
MVVQLEAFQGFVLERKINGQELTPNLNKLAKDSLVFENYYYQTAWGGTSDAEFLSNVSLLPARDGSVYYQYAGNKYDALPKELKGIGYFTAVMHANRPGFWNRTNMYRALGFDKYESEKDFNIDEIQGMGLSDKSFLNRQLKK